jgi:hypothetical protein
MPRGGIKMIIEMALGNKGMERFCSEHALDIVTGCFIAYRFAKSASQ